MTVYYMHHVLFLLVGPVFFLHVIENTILSKVNATGQYSFETHGCDVFEAGAIDDGFTGSGNTLLPSTLPVNPSGLAAFLILIFLKR